MANPTWPAALAPSACEWRLQKAGLQFRSPFSGSLQSIDFIGERWVVGLTFPASTIGNSGALAALLTWLAGGVNMIDIWRFGPAEVVQPRGTLRGSPTVKTVTVRGDTSLVLTVASNATLKAGDLIGAGSQVFMVASDCGPTGTTLTVPLVNRVRGVIAEASAVTWYKPKLAVVMPEMSAGIAFVPGQALPAQVQLEEAFV